ncbi:CsbD family protein [Plastoroseomonas arctica]
MAHLAPGKENAMNWDQIAGNWKQMTGKVREQWGKLTDDDLAVIGGQRDQLLGKVQERYGITKEQAEEQLATWESANK